MEQSSSADRLLVWAVILVLLLMGVLALAVRWDRWKKLSAFAMVLAAITLPFYYEMFRTTEGDGSAIGIWFFAMMIISPSLAFAGWATAPIGKAISVRLFRKEQDGNPRSLSTFTTMYFFNLFLFWCVLAGLVHLSMFVSIGRWAGGPSLHSV